MWEAGRIGIWNCFAATSDWSTSGAHLESESDSISCLGTEPHSLTLILAGDKGEEVGDTAVVAILVWMECIREFVCSFKNENKLNGIV